MIVKSQLKYILILNSITCSSIAFAAETASQSSMVSQLLLFGIIFVMFYFLMIRPQSKRQKEHKDFISKLAKGDEIVTTGGIAGKINRVADNFFIVVISEGVEIPVQKQAIATALPKGTIKSL